MDLRQYINQARTHGQTDDQICASLEQAGWPAEAVSSALTGRQDTAMPQYQQQHKPANPPIGAQIIFAFAVIGAIMGLLIVFGLTNQIIASQTTTAVDGVTPAYLASWAVVLLQIYGTTYLAWKLRSGRLWALKVFTGLYVLSNGALIWDYFSRTPLEKLLDSHIHLITIGVLAIIYAPALALLWTRNRSYFK